MSKYELYQQLDKWYKRKSITVLPKYLFERITYLLSNSK